MPAKSPTERRMVAQIAAHACWAKEPDRAARTEKMRRGLDARFLREADPEGTLPERVRAERAASLRKQYFRRMALLSAQARRKAAA